MTFPPHRQQAAYGAFAWRTVDEDLLTLTHDSALLADAAVRGVRRRAHAVLRGRRVSLELEVDDGRRHGPGAASGQRACEITIERADGESQTARADASGFFALTDAVRARALRGRASTGRVRRTAWIVI